MRTVLPARKVHQLLSDVHPFASGDDTLPSVASVQLVQDGRLLTATATDRYALGQSRVRVSEDDERETLPGTVLISRRNARTIAATFKPERNPIVPNARLVLETEGTVSAYDGTDWPEWLRIEAHPEDAAPFWNERAAVVLRVPVVQAKFPAITDKLIRPAAPMSALSLNLDYLTMVWKRRRSKSDYPRIIFTHNEKGDPGAVKVYLGNVEDDTEFRALIMPLRVPGAVPGESHALPSTEDWA